MMRNQRLLNLALVVAVAALAGLLWLDLEPTPAPVTVTTLTPGQINTVQVSYPDAPTLKLQREPSGWRITEPVVARAEPAQVQALLQLATTHAERHFAASEIDPHESGLDETARQVTFNNTAIRLGDTDPLNKQRYVQSGEQVYLIDDLPAALFDSDYSDLVSLRLLPKDSAITQLELPQVTLLPSDTGGWRVTPQTLDAGADAAQYTIDTWGHAQSLWNTPAQANQAAQGEAIVETEDGSRYRFEIIARTPQLTLRAPALGVDYHIAANQNAALLELKHPRTAEQTGALKEKPDIKLAP